MHYYPATQDEINDFTANNPDWQEVSGHLVRLVTGASFADIIGFVVRIADVAEELDHHPDMDIRWGLLRVDLTTHSAGGLTNLDLALAQRIEDVCGV